MITMSQTGGVLKCFQDLLQQQLRFLNEFKAYGLSRYCHSFSIL